MIINDPGSYLEVGGRPAVRFERIYEHPVDRVWRLVSDPAELARWFPSPQITIEPAAGGAITFSGDPVMPEATSTGRVLAFDPPRRFAFSWGGDELHFDLEPLDAGRTRFVLTNVLEARDTAARNAAGWDVCLAALDALAEDRAAEQPAWKPKYDAYVAAGLPSGAPIPGQGGA
ncbi:SRPBCC family protein [Actinomadura verrucosospora]|uniref:Activator of Hsp90 ATPase 1 family protein n=1 Tax=Actinomadura verrucosospora TaxID=46165 RepID=A0A7D4ARZ9_ACTVE|nr:SRPBCC family protein [Actinomadura verrucosospora]QKG23589.1 activator of Hsp90 ATPase 1 family protein [Actinomadura verrucosospora]